MFLSSYLRLLSSDALACWSQRGQFTDYTCTMNIQSTTSDYELVLFSMAIRVLC